MCGIAGFEVAPGEDARQQVRVALTCLANRGPDGAGWHLARRWALAQTRLAVVDLSDRVRYPMSNEDGDVFLLFNGEIYNYVDLRRQLRKSGHRFATECDAETVVHGYEEWGIGVFDRLNGMWALAIADLRRDQLLLSRDPFGIKPLVRTTGPRFAFASDAMALVRTGYSTGETDQEAVEEYLTFQYVPPDWSGLADVRQVEPGTVLVRNADGREVVERFTAGTFDRSPATTPVSVDEADAVLKAAVTRQLHADVPVGVFLSGGLDSALILSYATEAGARPTALTIGFAGFGAYDESLAAGQLCGVLGVEHVVENFALPDFETAISAVAGAYDIPLGDPSAIATLMLAKVAREYVTVALSGTGGDDLFAGYYRHRAHLIRRWVMQMPDGVLRRLSALPVDRGGERTTTQALLWSYVARLARARGVGPAQQYLGLVASSLSSRGVQALRSPIDAGAVADRTAERYGLTLASGVLDGLQAFELKTYLPGDLLLKEDRATMAHSVEGRVPFLDLEVADLAARTPANQRATLMQGKVLLRQIAERRLPTNTLRGGKRGFAVPLRALVDGAWATPMREWLSESSSSLVDPVALVHMLDAKSITALDAWVLTALIAWEQRVNHERQSARRHAT
jgi:asparagine synthase (glutamine-hydrolysing)